MIQELTMRTDKTALESIVFLEYFQHLSVYRQKGRVIYSLNELLLLSLLAALAGAETFLDIAQFGSKKLGF